MRSFGVVLSIDINVKKEAKGDVASNFFKNIYVLKRDYISNPPSAFMI